MELYEVQQLEAKYLQALMGEDYAYSFIRQIFQSEDKSFEIYFSDEEINKYFVVNNKLQCVELTMGKFVDANTFKQMYETKIAELNNESGKVGTIL